MHGTNGDLLLRPHLLQMRPEMRIGSALLAPATRSLAGPAGEVALEPRTLQLLVALAEADGEVVSRTMIEARVWGVPVSEDALNQAVAQLRRAARAAGGFRVETIPRTGYRLVADPGEQGGDPPAAAVPPPATASRRGLLFGGAAAAAAGIFGLAALLRLRPDPRVGELVAEGRQKLLYAAPHTAREAAALFAEATELAPRDAEVWGWRARAACMAAETAPPADVESTIAACRAVLEKAETLDRDDPNTVGARAIVRAAGKSLPEQAAVWEAALARSPSSVEVLSRLGALAQATGQSRRSRELVDRALSIEPDHANLWLRRAIARWIMGDWRRCDLIADEAIRRWPRHPIAWFVRVTTLAFSGRPRAALRLLDEPGPAAAGIGRDTIGLWRLGLVALESRAQADIEAARTAFVAAAPGSPGAAVQAILYLSTLGEAGLALAIAEGLLLHRGAFAGPTAGAAVGLPLVGDIWWRRSPWWLFAPATAALRADPRFPAFARDLGLVAYWKAAGVRPDPIHGLAPERFGL